MQSKNQLVGVVLALLLFFALIFVLNKVNPAPKPAAAPTSQSELPPELRGAADKGGPAATTQSSPTTATSSSAPAFTLTAGTSTARLQVASAALDVTFNPRGGSIDTVDLVSKDKKGRYLYREELDSPQPYRVVAPVSTMHGDATAFSTLHLWLTEREGPPWRLDDLVWEAQREGPEQVAFSTALAEAGGTPVIRLRKTFTVSPDKPVIILTLTAENASATPRTIVLEQGGPVGVQREDINYRDMRRLIAAAKLDDGRVEMGRPKMRAELAKQLVQSNESVHLIDPNKRALWAAAIDKYFGVFVRPIDLAAPTQYPNFIYSADGTVVDRSETDAKQPDLLVKLLTKAKTIEPGKSENFSFEIYCGPKDAHVLEAVNPAYVESAKLSYKSVTSLDQSCCTFAFLLDFMSSLLHGIQYLVRNYGVAIIILVIIVRTLMHPLAVMQQKRMYRFQEVMSRVQPKMNDINTRFANDAQRKQQEIMKMYAEEGINPLAPLLAMAPLFVQLPILGALWGALNSDVMLRHAPFDGWWIKDLSSPDAFWRFSTPLSIPVLSMLPLVGRAFENIPSINLLPILMGVSMFLQQKYMPKPAMAKRMEEARKKAASANPTPGGPSFEDQMRQQQVAANMMSIMFPLMFYYTPSGLSLYWMATNIFGICESLLIRRQIDAEHRRGEQGLVVPKGPKKPGPIARFIQKALKQMEELQKQADTMSDRKKGR